MKRLLAVCALTVMPLLAQSALAQEAEPDKNKVAGMTLTGNLTLMSDYVSRGLTASNHGPALQGTFNATHDNSGLYVNVFASSVNFNDGNGASLELDPSLGWTKEWENGVSMDLGVLQYLYPYMKAGKNFDYREYYVGGGYKVGSAALKGKYSYSDAYMGNQLDAKDHSASYLEAQLTYELPEVLPFKTTLKGHAGRAFGDFFTDSAKKMNMNIDGLNDYSVGVAAEFAAGLGAGVDFILVDQDGRRLAAGGDADTRLIGNVSKSF